MLLYTSDGSARRGVQYVPLVRDVVFAADETVVPVTLELVVSEEEMDADLVFHVGLALPASAAAVCAHSSSPSPRPSLSPHLLSPPL